MRRVILAAGSLATALTTLFAAAAGPAAAEPARANSASGYGLSASGLVAISPTITSQAAYPPGGDNSVSGNLGGSSPTLITLPLGSLALAGVVGVTANAHQADDITPELASVPNQACGGTSCSEPVTVSPDNTRGLAKTAGAGVLFTPTSGSTDPVATLLQQLGGLLTADAVTAEAVAKCVNNRPVFETGFQVAGLGGLVGGVVNPLLQPILNTLFGLIGPGATLSSIISVTPGAVTPLADGVAIDGLRVSIPILNENIVISHAEAHMPTNCAVEVGPPTGPGPVAPTGRLASTGSEFPYLPLGMGLMVMALIGSGIVRRTRHSAVK